MRNLKLMEAETSTEARRLRSSYVEHLQTKAAQAEGAVRREQAVRQQLQADCEYNLQLVRERDEELSRYDAAVVELRQAVNLLTGECSELKVSLEEREAEVEREREQRREKVASLQAQIESMRRAQREGVDMERRRCEDVKRVLEDRLREVEGEGERVKIEISTHFEEETHKFQLEHRAQVDQLEAAVMEVQSQLRSRERELEQVRQLLHRTEEDRRGVKERVGELERQKKALEWAWQNKLAAMETDIVRVRAELEQSLSMASASEAHLQHKCSELDQEVREKTRILQTAKEYWVERESELQGRICQLQTERESEDRKFREQLEKRSEQLKEKDAEIERLEREILNREEHDKRRESQLAVMSEQQLQLTRERDDLQSSLTTARSELLQARRAVCEDVEKREKDLRESVREAEMRASARSQTTLRALSQDRHKLVAEVTSLRKELSKQEQVINRVTNERDVAIATLKSHNPSLLEKNDVTPQPEDQLACEVLTQQNAQLRVAVSTMTRELDQLTSRGGRSFMAHEKMEERVGQLERALAASESRLRETQEELVQLRAVRVAPEKCQEKLLQATRSILCLLRERDSLSKALQTEFKGRDTEAKGECPSNLPGLLFTDSEVEGQRSLEQLMENSLSISPGTEPHPPTTITMATGGKVAIEMQGKHMQPIQRKPNICRTRSHIHH